MFDIKFFEQPDEDDYNNLNIKQMLEDYTKLGNQARVSQILLADASIRKSACWFNVTCALAEQGKELASKYI